MFVLEDESNQLTIDRFRSKRYIERFYSTDMPVLKTMKLIMRIMFSVKGYQNIFGLDDN